MSGTLQGGKKASVTNRKRHGEDFFKRIGKIGGLRGHTGGWASKTPCECDVINEPHTRPQCRGLLGGRKSKRT